MSSPFPFPIKMVNNKFVILRNATEDNPQITICPKIRYPHFHVITICKFIYQCTTYSYPCTLDQITTITVCCKKYQQKDKNHYHS